MKIIAGEETVSITADNVRSVSLQKVISTVYVILRYTFLLFLLILLASHEAANSKSGIEFFSVPFRDALKNVVENESPIKSFYDTRNYTPAWTKNFEVNRNYDDLLAFIGNSYNYGLLPSFYGYKRLRKLEKLMNGSKDENDKLKYRIELEQMATKAAFVLSTHLAFGLSAEDSTLVYTTFNKGLPGYLNQQLTNNTLEKGFLKLQPDNKYYRDLQKALAKYMKIASGDTMYLSAEELLGSKDMMVRKLISQGYLNEDFAGDTSAFGSAIRNFQRMHYLDITGKTDMETLHLLSRNTRDKFYRIALNLDRIRKDHMQDANFILVNIPEYRLHYYDDQGKCVNFNIIVGKKETPTPILTSQVEMIITNPHWTVPQSISRNEIIPLLKKDSLYLQKHGFIVVDNKSNPVNVDSVNWSAVVPHRFNYWFRQVKTDNALGNVKFLFPNEYAVYLHDTPSRNLFKTRNRTYSHGCIRLENPVSFAGLLVSGNEAEITGSEIENIVKDKKLREIRLKKPVPIYIRYYSCIADNNGNITFYPDIYCYDESAILQLFGNTPWN